MVAAIRLNMKKVASLATLFFIAVDIQKEGTKPVSFTAQCLLCGNCIAAFRNVNGVMQYQDNNLEKHLHSSHRLIGSQIKQTFTTFTFNSVSSSEAPGSITAFFQKSSSPTQERHREEIEEECTEYHPPPPPLAPSSISSSDVMRTMRIIMSNIALSWDKQNKQNELYWSDELAKYNESNKRIEEIYGDMKYYIKHFLSGISEYSFSCDCWSVLNADFKAICFFVHVYYDNQFVSLLLDVVSMKNSTAESIRAAFDDICKNYELDKNKYIVTDNASSNKKCFKVNRIGCFAHRLNTACAHLTSLSKRETGGLTKTERKKISEFFSVAEHVCQIFRGRIWSDFTKWFESNKEKIWLSDVANCKLTKPTKPCNTRWIGRLVYLTWLRDFGVIAFRFLHFTGHNGIDLVAFHNCLIQVPQVLSLLNIMNNALELLAVEKKSSAHLVYPLLYYLRVIFDVKNSENANTGGDFENEGDLEEDEWREDEDEDEDEDEEINTNDVIGGNGKNDMDKSETNGGLRSVPNLILKCFRYELTKGCLTLSRTEEKIFKTAACCYPSLCDYSPEVYKECEDFGSESYANTVNIGNIARGYVDYKKYVESSLSTEVSIHFDDDNSPFHNALCYHKDGLEGVSLRGNHCNDVAEGFESHLKLSLNELQKRLESIKKSSINKRTGSKKREENEVEKSFIYKLISVKRRKYSDGYNGQTMASQNNCFGYTEGLDGFVRSTMSTNLYNIPHINQCNPNNRSMQTVCSWLQKSLHYPATESACERFFRQLSLVVKKPYRTNMGGEKSCHIAFLHYYAKEIYYLLGNGKVNKHSLVDILFDRIEFHVC